MTLKAIVDEQKGESTDPEISDQRSEQTSEECVVYQFKMEVVAKLKEIKERVIELVKRQESSTNLVLSNEEIIPWRLCMAGGWLDQPWVSKVAKGPVIVMNVDYHSRFKNRSGLATSSRSTALKLWKRGNIPNHLDNEEIAKLVFGAENPPGTKYVSGSQDHLGLFLPGINRLDFDGGYWPHHITTMSDVTQSTGKNFGEIQKFIEKMLWLIPLDPRPDGYDPLVSKQITESKVQRLADASDAVWNAMLECDAVKLGKAFTETIKATKAILPNAVPDYLDPIWKKYDAETHGCLFTGCGGGFLMIIADEKPRDDAFQIKINSLDWWRNTE